MEQTETQQCSFNTSRYSGIALTGFRGFVPFKAYRAGSFRLDAADGLEIS